MRIFLAGATGVIGRRVVPLLVGRPSWLLASRPRRRSPNRSRNQRRKLLLVLPSWLLVLVLLLLLEVRV